MKSITLLIFCQLAAYWPVWVWYVRRMFDGSDEPFGLLALITAGVFVCIHAQPAVTRSRTIVLTLIALIAYLVSFTVLPPLLRAVIAITAVALGLSDLFPRQKVHIGLLGLLLLSLPLVASLQFYLGYPLRCLNAAFAVEILKATGVQVAQQGINLYWLGEVVVVDAPCSGIKMLWAGLYLAFTLSCFFNLNNRQTCLAYSVAGLTIFLGNTLRTVLLFYLETGSVAGPGWLHEAIGVGVFMLIAMAITKEVQSIKGRGHAPIQA